MPSFKPALALIAVASVSAHAQSFTPLGTASSSIVYSEADGVSADGSVVVGSIAFDKPTGSLDLVLFRWTPSGGMQFFGQDLPDRIQVQVQALSDDGSTVVGYMDDLSEAGTPRRPFRWTEAEGFVMLDELPGGSDRGIAFDVSADGSVIVGEGTTESGPEAVRWDGDVPTGLGRPAGATQSFAVGVNADGSVIAGAASFPGGENRQFRYEGGAWVALDSMAEAGITGAQTFGGISADGKKIAMNNFDLDFADAYLFRASGTIGRIGNALLLSDDRLNVNDVNSDGSVAIGTFLGASLMCWSAAEGPVNLNARLQAEYGIDTSGWTSWVPRRVSADGLTMVGWGANPDGDREGWIVRLPGAGGSNACVADINTKNVNPGDPGYGTPDGEVDGADLSYFVEQWLAGCP